jgi:sulfur relay (sulfurtransferase) DsrC/TusE family protein
MDQRFLIKCIDLDVAQYIDSQPHKWLLKFIVEFYIQYKVSPTM